MYTHERIRRVLLLRSPGLDSKLRVPRWQCAYKYVPLQVSLPKSLQFLSAWLFGHNHWHRQKCALVVFGKSPFTTSMLSENQNLETMKSHNMIMWSYGAAYTVRCRYNAITNIHKRHPIAHPLPRNMGCLCCSSNSLIFCHSSCKYLCNILEYWTAL